MVSIGNTICISVDEFSEYVSPFFSRFGDLNVHCSSGEDRGFCGAELFSFQ